MFVLRLCILVAVMNSVLQGWGLCVFNDAVSSSALQNNMRKKKK